MSIIGVGHYYPGEPVPNSFFEGNPQLGVTNEWIVEHTGVHQRHFAANPEERIVEMGAKASRLAMEDAGVSPDDVDLVIGTSATARPRTNPSSVGNNYMDISLPLQSQLRLSSAFCFDVTAVACAGFLYASAVARGLMATMKLRTALVVCAENPQPILNPNYRNSVLFGAGAAATVMRMDGASTSGIRDIVLKADSSYYNAFDIDDHDKMIMKGKLVGEMGPRFLVDAAKTVLSRNEVLIDDIAWCIPHQGNINLLNSFADEMQIPRDRVLLNLPQRGNTSSAGLPGTLSEYVRCGTVKPSELLLGVSIGRGFSWGAMLFSYR
ncbi:3-oxoacyl-ACP synthase III family protein [Streptomyces sp. NPDC058701]|uniref:3-oxoacyl-ACP synthase III family protein n=1 Tax=Streptomyces sp. NPDC058701 TaxID=3346608 RepID=UPI00366265CB